MLQATSSNWERANVCVSCQSPAFSSGPFPCADARSLGWLRSASGCGAPLRSHRQPPGTVHPVQPVAPVCNRTDRMIACTPVQYREDGESESEASREHTHEPLSMSADVEQYQVLQWCLMVVHVRHKPHISHTTCKRGAGGNDAGAAVTHRATQSLWVLQSFITNVKKVPTRSEQAVSYPFASSPTAIPPDHNLSL